MIDYFHRRMNLWFHVLNSVVELRMLMKPLGEHYHQLKKIDSHSKIKSRDGRTRKKDILFLPNKKQNIRHTQKNGRNVGEESSSALKRKVIRWKTNWWEPIRHTIFPFDLTSLHQRATRVYVERFLNICLFFVINLWRQEFHLLNQYFRKVIHIDYPNLQEILQDKKTLK